jgi:hypothetical protein
MGIYLCKSIDKVWNFFISEIQRVTAVFSHRHKIRIFANIFIDAHIFYHQCDQFGQFRIEKTALNADLINVLKIAHYIISTPK